MAKTSNDNQNTPAEPPLDEQAQGSTSDPNQEQELEQPGQLSPDTAINPKIKNL